MSNLFYFFISFIIALFFMMIGLIGMMIPWSSNIRDLLTKFILEDSIAISLFGFVFFIIGFAIIANVLLTTKRRYYKINSQKVSARVDEAVIQEYLHTYWKQLFPKYDIPCHLTFKDNKIHITVDLPYLPLPEQKPILERIRKDLVELLTQILGYRDEFFLAASFQSKRGESI